MDKHKLSIDFKILFWWLDFSKLDIQADKAVIISQTINYGSWEQWKYLIRLYGKSNIKRIIENIPASVFRPSVLKLAAIVFGAKNIKYATRSDKIKAEKNL